MPEPQQALSELARALRDERSVVSPHVVDTAADPAAGILAAAGPRAASAPGEYALVVEAVREGYLLHYGEPRIVTGADRDLALLAGDYLYALGLERLAALGDLEAVRELSDLISLSAQLHADGSAGDGASALWLASVVAVAAGPSPEHGAAKEALRAGDPRGGQMLATAAMSQATRAGLGQQLEHAAEAVGFGASDSR